MKSKPRILFIGNFLLRHWGRGRTGIDMRLAAGAVRLGCPHLTFSERDVARFLAPLGFMRGIGAKMMNERLLRTVRNFRPDIVFIAHCDYVENKTLLAMKEALPSLRIVHINCDAIWQEHTRSQIFRRKDSCDAIFVTTAGEELRDFSSGRNVVGFFPNPCDAAYDIEDNSAKTEFKYDLFFAGRPQQIDNRRELVEKLERILDPSVRRGFFGMGKAPLLLGRDYEEVIASSKMGLSINRKEGWKWYASDRITHLMASGCLTYQHSGNRMQDFFTDEETVYFSSVDELAEKIAYYNTHDDERRSVSRMGREKYFKLFNSERTLKYMMEAALGEEFSESYEWAGDVYR